MQFWKGCKLHLDVTDLVSRFRGLRALASGANVHDSQTRNVTHIYTLMDAAYDAAEISDYILATGRVALTDRNKRRNDTLPPIDPASRTRFQIRSTVERSNAHLKDWLLPDKLVVQSYEKVIFYLMTGVVYLAAIKILQYMIMTEIGILAPTSSRSKTTQWFVSQRIL